MKLSYIITTRNKLPRLRAVLSGLLAQRANDEEILVVDGGSTDGTVDYLRSLYDRGLIQKYVSERDFGEAHGFNKGILEAKGELVRCVTDDDAFYWPEVRKCREFLLANPAIDMVGTDGALTNWSSADPFMPSRHAEHFRAHLAGKMAHFWWPGLGLMFRRSAMALTGLFDTRFTIVDLEFSLRVSTSKARLAWYTGSTFVWIPTKASNSVAMARAQALDRCRLSRYYGVIHNGCSWWDSALDGVKAMLRGPKHALLRIQPKPFPPPEWVFPANEDWEAGHRRCIAWLEESNRRFPGEFVLPPAIGGSSSGVG